MLFQWLTNISELFASNEEGSDVHDCTESEPLLETNSCDELHRQLVRSMASKPERFCFIKCLSVVDQFTFSKAYVEFVIRHVKPMEHNTAISVGKIPLFVWKKVLDSVKLECNYNIWEAVPSIQTDHRLLFEVRASIEPTEARRIHIVLHEGHLKVLNCFIIFRRVIDSPIPWRDLVGCQHGATIVIDEYEETFLMRSSAVHPNSNMRKVIAKRLTEPKATVPHFYTSIECEIDALMALRKTFKKDMELNIRCELSNHLSNTHTSSRAKVTNQQTRRV